MSDGSSSKPSTINQEQTESLSKRQLGRAPWAPLQSLFVALASSWGLQVFIGVVIVSFMLAFGMTREGILDWSESVWGAFSLILVSEIATVMLILWFVKWRKGNKYHLGIDRFKPGYIFYAVIGVVIYFAFYILLFGVIKALIPGLDDTQEQSLPFKNVNDLLELAAVFVGLVLLPPIVEEFVFRGFLYSGIRSRLTWLPSAIIVSIIFGALHLQLGEGSPPLWIAMIDTFVLSMVMCYFREKTGSLWTPVLMHMAKNGIAYYFLFVVPVLHS